MKPKVKPKLDRNKYYIVDSIDLFHPRLLWNEFNFAEDADDAIFKYLDNSSMRYSVCKGSKAIFHKLKFYWDLTTYKGNKRSMIFIPKYDVPPRIKTSLKDRKHYRRLIRRKLRNLEKGNY